ncbi:MAG TPA: hypothetical protein OIM50_07290 [Clostridiaceae bacterium]|nr:hypothetical protein [Clostridiaceae bacterium]
MEEIKEINEDIIRLKEAMNMIREREKSIKEQKEALEDETRIVKAQREEQKIAKAEEDLKEFKDLTIEIILRMANKVKEIRKTAQMQYIKDSVNAVRAVQERKNLQNKRIKLLNKKNAELNNDKLTETERARKEKFIEAISIKIENEQKEIDGLPNVKKVEENWKKTSDDLNNAEETLNKYRLILLGIRVQTQNEYEQDEPTPNRPVQGEPMPNRPVPGESTPSEPVQDEQEQGEPTPSEPVQDEQAQDEPTQGEPAQGEPAQEEQAQGEPAPSRPAQGEPTPNRPVQGEPTPSEPVQDEQEQGESTPSEPVQGEQEQDEPIEQPELVDKAIIRATEEVRRKTMELKALKQMYDKMYDKYDRLIAESESAEERKEAEGCKEEIMKVWETRRKKAKELEDNYGIYALDSLETMSAIICGNYNEDVKDGIRRWSVLRDKGIEMRKHYKDLWNNGRYSEAEQYFENSGLSTIRQREDLLRDKAFQRLTEEEKSKISDIYSKGYIGGVNIDLENDEISVLVGDNSRLKIIQRRYYPKKGEIEQTKRGILEKYGIKMKRREIRNLDLQILDALEAVAIKDDKNPSEEDITALKEYITAYHKSLTDNPDRPRIAIAYNGEKINEKSFNASKKYMRQAQKFGGTIPEGCDVRTPWQKFIDFLKKPKMIEEGDGKEESEQQGEQTDEKTPQGGQAAKDFRDRNHDEKAAATVGETAQQNAQKAQGTQDRTEGNAEQEK